VSVASVPMNPVLIRMLTAAVLLAVFFPAVLLAPAWLWALLVSAVIMVGAHEWARLSQFPGSLPVVYAALVGLIALGLSFLPAADAQAVQAALFVLAAAFWVVLAPLWLAFGWQARAVFIRAAIGLTVLLPTWAAILYLRDAGPWVLIGIMAVVWIADSAAYFSGRAFGRRKLAPHISPGKTWEGVAGALLALLLYGALMNGFQSVVSLPLLLLMVVVLFYFSVLGDLFESWIKRVAGMKDSGRLLPGHGGVLDRIDAMTSALPIAAGMLILLGRGV
jgi:phosphatidate cytidylyltransferase